MAENVPAMKMQCISVPCNTSYPKHFTTHFDPENAGEKGIESVKEKEWCDTEHQKPVY
jgi:hypothetical protein